MGTPERIHHRIRIAFFAVLFFAASNVLFAQFDIIRDIGKEALKGSSSLLEGEPPITTSLEDAQFADESRDGFEASPMRNLNELERTPNGGFVLVAGAFHLSAQSYCLKAGTHGPGGGDGYLYAPPLGPAEEAVLAIVRNSVAHPSIQQSSI